MIRFQLTLLLGVGLIGILGCAPGGVGGDATVEDITKMGSDPEDLLKRMDNPKNYLERSSACVITGRIFESEEMLSELDEDTRQQLIAKMEDLAKNDKRKSVKRAASAALAKARAATGGGSEEPAGEN